MRDFSIIVGLTRSDGETETGMTLEFAAKAESEEELFEQCMSNRFPPGVVEEIDQVIASTPFDNLTDISVEERIS